MRAGDSDLSLVLRRLMSRNSSTRKTDDARRRLANDERTRAFLAAGLQLVSEQLDALDEHLQDENEDETRRPFFEWLSRKQVVRQAAQSRPELVPTDGMFRDRWPYQEDYIEDLLAFSLWERHWSLHVSTALESRDLLISDRILCVLSKRWPIAICGCCSTIPPIRSRSLPLLRLAVIQWYAMQLRQLTVWSARHGPSCMTLLFALGTQTPTRRIA